MRADVDVDAELENELSSATYAVSVDTLRRAWSGNAVAVRHVDAFASRTRVESREHAIGVAVAARLLHQMLDRLVEIEQRSSPLNIAESLDRIDSRRFRRQLALLRDVLRTVDVHLAFSDLVVRADEILAE